MSECIKTVRGAGAIEEVHDRPMEIEGGGGLWMERGNLPRSRNRPQMDGMFARQQMAQQEVWPKFVIIIIIIGA